MIINFEILVTVGVASFVLAKIWSGVIDRLPFWKRLTELGREIGGYVIMLANAALMWSTGLDMLPGFNKGWALLGQVLTCIVAGVAPSLVYDIWLDKPVPPNLKTSMDAQVFKQEVAKCVCNAIRVDTDTPPGAAR